MVIADRIFKYQLLSLLNIFFKILPINHIALKLAVYYDTDKRRNEKLEP